MNWSSYSPREARARPSGAKGIERVYLYKVYSVKMQFIGNAPRSQGTQSRIRVFGSAMGGRSWGRLENAHTSLQSSNRLRESWLGPSFRAQRGISLRRQPKKRGIPHSAHSVRNDGMEIFHYPAIGEDWEFGQTVNRAVCENHPRIRDAHVHRLKKPAFYSRSARMLL